VVAGGDGHAIGVVDGDDSSGAEVNHGPKSTGHSVGRGEMSVLDSVVGVAEINVYVSSDCVLFSDFFELVVGVVETDGEETRDGVDGMLGVGETWSRVGGGIQPVADVCVGGGNTAGYTSTNSSGRDTLERGGTGEVESVGLHSSCDGSEDVNDGTLICVSVVKSTEVEVGVKSGSGDSVVARVD